MAIAISVTLGTKQTVAGLLGRSVVAGLVASGLLTFYLTTSWEDDARSWIMAGEAALTFALGSLMGYLVIDLLNVLAGLPPQKRTRQFGV